MNEMDNKIPPRSLHWLQLKTVNMPSVGADEEQLAGGDVKRSSALGDIWAVPLRVKHTPTPWSSPAFPLLSQVTPETCCVQDVTVLCSFV